MENTFVLEVHFPAGNYILTGLSISALIQEIQRADDAGLDIIGLTAYREPKHWTTKIINQIEEEIKA
jgi:hypothetical protein